MNKDIHKGASHKGIVAWFASNPVAANLLMLVIVLAGVFSGSILKVEGWPGFSPKSVAITVVYPSGSAETTAEGVTVKIEETLDSVQGVKKIHSQSDANGTRITVDKTSGYDLDTLYRDVKNKVDTISTLPASAEKPIVSKESSIATAINVNVYGDVEQDVLQDVAVQLRDQFLANPDIELVAFQGKQTPEITIQVDEAQLQALDLTLSDVATKLGQGSLLEGNGQLFSADGVLTIKADQQRYWLREFESIVIKETSGGQRLTLGDIATVHDGYEQSGILSRFNGQPSVGLDVQRYNRTGDAVKITGQVNEVVADFRKTLPVGIQVETWNDQSVQIKDRLGLMLNNGLLGASLIMLVLSLFLSIRLAFWVAVGLPVIFAGAMLLLGPSFINLSLNEMTTFGLILVLGIVVDDAVVVSESIHTEQQKYGASLASTIRGAQRVTTPTVFGVLTTVAAFGSLTLVKGDMGEVFTFFVYSSVFCLFFAMIESKLILPAHLAGSLQQKRKPGNPVSKAWGIVQSFIANGLSSLINHVYRPFLTKALGLRYATLMIMISVFILVGGMVLSGKIRTSFFPDIPDESIQVQLSMDEQAGYGLIQQQATIIEEAGIAVGQQLAEEFNMKESPIAQVTMLTDGNSATLKAGLTPVNTRSVSTNEIVARWQAAIGPLEAVSQLKFITSWSTVPDLEIELRSRNVETLQAAGAQVIEALKQYKGVSAIQNSMKTGQAQIDLSLRPEGRAMGLTVSDLAKQIRYAYDGFEVQRIQRGRDEIKVKVRYPDHKRQWIDDLNLARIRTADGKVVQLGTVADIATRYVAKDIKRVDRNRVAVISADIDKSMINANDILKVLDDTLFDQLETSYRDLTIKVGGEAQEQAETGSSMLLAFATALLGIYVLLAIPLKSYLQPLLIMVSIPFGVIGALIGHWLHGIEFSLLSMFGIVALSGVVVNNSLLLATRYNELKDSGMASREAIIEAACSRMRAVVITSLTTYFGLIPMITETSTSALFLIPAALAMGYGVLFGALITLVLVPALMAIVSDFMPETKATETAIATH